MGTEVDYGTKIGLYEDALNIIVGFLIIDVLDSSELLEIWVKVKREGNSSNIKYAELLLNFLIIYLNCTIFT